MTKKKVAKRNGPKVLFLDIETAPILGYVWSIWEQNVGLNQIAADWFILSWAAKWLGDTPDKIMYADQSAAKNVEDDSALLSKLWNLLDEADIIVTQNGRHFDQRKIFARFVIQGFQPPSSFKHIDTKIIAQRAFGFTSNKLEYMTDKLNKKYKKLKHAKFAGFELWKECLAGNPKAWAEMKKYNMYDVLSLEELYHTLLPWASNAPNFNLYTDDLEHTCRCGGTEFKKQGFAYTGAGKFQRYRCKACGAESRDKTNLLSKEKRKSLQVDIPR